ncbi:MAG: Glu/Leu/Phe/Val dehydrogenase [Candidatus Eisenbacteria bacterium]|nr:Glu/Leu/Phe/Val dehydrogenase [Candidatus Eisenbacteria bacterium]
MKGEEPRVITVEDREAGLLGWVVIDSAVAGQSSGGLRMHPRVDDTELRLLARTMTRKYAFLGMPKGGAKAGIRHDPEDDPERVFDLLARFGRVIRPLILSRAYIPGPDMGTDDERIRALFRASGAPFRPGDLWRYELSGRFTAAGVTESFFRAVAALGIPEKDLSVAVEGVGAVGLEAARMLARRGVRIAAIANAYGRIAKAGGIDPEDWAGFARRAGCEKIAGFPGATPLTHEEFLALPVTAFLPCATIHTIDEKDAGRLAAPVIVPGANDPLAPGARSALEARGVLVLPDFVVNAGGVLGGALAHAGIGETEVLERTSALIGDVVEHLLRRSDSLGAAPAALAERLAHTRRERAVRGLRPRLLLLGLVLQRTGLLFPAARRAAARRYAAGLAKSLARDIDAIRT